MSRQINKSAVLVEPDNDMRLRILEAAAELFIENGFYATPLDTVGARVGLHKATLYHYIESKDEILYECLRLSFNQISEAADKLTDKSIAPLERLRLFFKLFAIMQSETFGRCLALVGAQPLKKEKGGRIRDAQRRFDYAIREVIQEGIECGDIKPFRPETLSAMIFGIYNAIPRWYKTGGRLSPEKISDLIFDLICFGVRADCLGGDAPPSKAAKALYEEIKKTQRPEEADTQFDRIVQAAAVKFAEQDFDATSLNQIAKNVGINKATLYHYIKSKDDLLALSLERSFENFEEMIAALKESKLPASDRLWVFYLSLLNAQNTVYGRCVNLVSPQAQERSSRDAIYNFKLRLDNAAWEICKAGVRSGEFRNAPRIVVMTALFGASNWVPRWFRPHQPGGLEYVANTFCDVLVNGMALKKPDRL